MKIGTILDNVDSASLALPTFQRGFVWNREQVRRFMNSLYRRHPVGSLLVWETATDDIEVRGDASRTPEVVRLLLDGQQRVTTLYGLARGKPPPFFDGNVKTLTGLYFHLHTEEFAFYQPSRMRGEPLWVDVTELIQRGVWPILLPLQSISDLKDHLTEYGNRLNALATIRDVELHIDHVTGDDKSIDVVVDIFNEVNSGGTKLSKGDLALAKVCAAWPEARQEMQVRLAKWQDAGFDFKLDWLLRCVNTIVTGEAMFTVLGKVDVATFQQGLTRAEESVDALLNLISSCLGLDHDRVLGSRYSFPLLARYVADRGGDFGTDLDQGKLLYWYVHTMLWGRYSGSTETVLAQDLALIKDGDDGLARLIDQLELQRGHLQVMPHDFSAWGRGSRIYPLLYMLTRVGGARDWGNGIRLSAQMLGAMGQLHLHHIFPKSLLYGAGYSKEEVNSLANFTFLTAETNQAVSNRDPAEYLPEYAAKHAGVLESHWIPMDSTLWSVNRFSDFLDARREALAAAANQMLNHFLEGSIDSSVGIPHIVDRQMPGGVASEDEDREIRQCKAWVERLGLPAGEIMYELTDAESGEALAIVDLAWPDGLQPGLSVPIALLIDEDAEIEQIVNEAGYRFFTDIDAFRRYVALEILPGEIAA